MAIQYCEYCHKYIDLDWNCEHFDDNNNCEIELDTIRDENLKYIDKKLEEK